MIELSIIIPVYNEINYLDLFSKRLISSFEKIKTEYIFINDGSNDGSEEWLKTFCENNKKSNCKLINIRNNTGKGNAIHCGIKIASGKYILFQDADLELDTNDSREMYSIINENNNIECIFGSRYLSGKLKKNDNYLNEFIGKFNSLIFNLLFSQSLSDLHCGTKIISKRVLSTLNLTIKDFGFEIDVASQIAKKKYDIYEYGISFFSRTRIQGKKITWVDGIQSYYYLFKTRFLQNDSSTTISLIYSICYMFYLGSQFGANLLQYFSISLFVIFGAFIGLHRKILSSTLVFVLSYLGIFVYDGVGKIFIFTILFISSLYISGKLSKIIKKYYKNKYINFLF